MSPRRINALVRNEFRLIAQDPLPIMILVAFPLIMMAFLKPTFRLALLASGHRGATGAEQVVPGQAVSNGFYIVGMTSFAFFAEHAWKTWDRLRVGAGSAADIVIGKTLPRLAVSLLQFLVLFAIGVPLFDLRSRGPLFALVPLVIAFAVCLVLFGVLVTALCRTVQQANAVSYGGIVVFGAIGGALVPLEGLPAWAHHMAPATPTYWAMRGFRSVILSGGSIHSQLLPIIVLTAMSAGFALVSLARFRLDDAKIAY
jgi:ABC-2 type transport system permease protein